MEISLQTSSFGLSSNDLWFLLKLFSPAYIIGMANPQLGWLTEEIDLADRESANHLMDMGLVNIQNGNAVEIDGMLHFTVQTMAHSIHTLIIRYGVPISSKSQHFVYFHDGQIIDHVKQKDDIHKITVIRNGNDLLEFLVSGIDNSYQKDELENSFSISEEFLLTTSAEYGKNNPQNGNELLLKESNINSSSIQQLHEALSNTQLNRSYVMIRNQGNRDLRQVSGFGLLKGENHFWMLNPTEIKGKTIIQFTPTKLDAIKDKLLSTLPIEIL